jgi:hypothetical protein
MLIPLQAKVRHGGRQALVVEANLLEGTSGNSAHGA